MFGKGFRDAFVTTLNATGTGIINSSFLGGDDQEEGHGIALDSAANTYVGGFTASTNFPVTPGVVQTTIKGTGNFDLFLAKLGKPRRFNICPLYDLALPRQSGSTVPLKIQLCDANANNLSSPQIRLKAVSISPLSNLAKTLPVSDSGNANPGGLFRFVGTKGGAYVFNLDTSNLAAGRYALRIQVNNSPNGLSTSLTIK